MNTIRGYPVICFVIPESWRNWSKEVQVIHTLYIGARCKICSQLEILLNLEFQNSFVEMLTAASDVTVKDIK